MRDTRYPLYHRDALSLVEKIPGLWRKLRGKCVECGGHKTHDVPGCLHCAKDRTRCHNCNKYRTYLEMYGGNPDRGCQPNCKCYLGPWT